MYYIHTYSILN